MKKILPILFITSLLIYFSSCEKDDICVSGDTPQLVIGFFDIEDTTAAKEVPSLRIRSLDNDSILDNDSFSDRANSPDSLLVPLRISATNTSYEFILDSGDDEATQMETGDIDPLTISYTTSEAFVSRACGFVVNYDGLSITLQESENNWIKDIRIVQPTVENSDNIHVKIFH